MSGTRRRRGGAAPARHRRTETAREEVDAAAAFGVLVELVARRAADLVLAELSEAAANGRRMPRPDGVPRPRERDYATEAESFLDSRGGATTDEVARSLQVRRSTVLELLETDGRFADGPPPPGRNPGARWWTLAQDPIPRDGMGRDGHGSARTGFDPSAASATRTRAVGGDQLVLEEESDA